MGKGRNLWKLPKYVHLIYDENSESISLLLKKIIWISLDKKKNQYMKRGGRDLSESIFESLWCELTYTPKLPPQKEVLFKLDDFKFISLVNIVLSRHYGSQNNPWDQGQVSSNNMWPFGNYSQLEASKNLKLEEKSFWGQFS